MYRAPSAWKSVLVIAEDLVGAAPIAHRTSGAMQRDFVELVSKSPLRARAAHPLKPLSQRLRDRFSLGLAGQFGQCTCELLGLLVPDVQRHGSPRVDQLLHVITQ